ncbi:MAG: hypothetical protein ACERLG_06660 [Sedimentibacter sp.]
MKKIVFIILTLILFVGCQAKDLSSGPSEYEQYIGIVELNEREYKLINMATNSDSLIYEYKVDALEQVLLVVDWYENGEIIETQKYASKTNEKEGFIVINSSDASNINLLAHINNSTVNVETPAVYDNTKMAVMRRGFGGNVELDEDPICIYYKGYTGNADVESISAIDFEPYIMRQFDHGFSIKVIFE